MTEYDYTTPKRSWTRLFILLSLLLLVGVLIWAVFFRTSGAGETPTHHTNAQTTNPPKSTSVPKKSQSTTQSTSTPNNTNPQSSTSTDTDTNNASPSKSSDLANTGPGNDFAIFIGASLFGVMVNYARIYVTKRLRDTV